jgi:hypothetical protein
MWQYTLILTALGVTREGRGPGCERQPWSDRSRQPSEYSVHLEAKIDLEEEVVVYNQR